jgi:hypothetical protein
MAITTLDQYLAAAKQTGVLQKKTASITAVALMLSSPFAAAGIPGAGTLAGTSTSPGVVPTDADAGFPIINAFGGSTGYITRLNGYNSVASTIILVDILYKAGAYAYNAAISGITSPSFSTRIPGGTDYTGLELWFECVTAFTGNPTITVAYLDQGGAAGTTGAIATGIAPIVGRCIRLNLAAGDSGVSGITAVTSTVATVGTFNILIVRPLARMRIPVAGYGESRDLYGTGMPVIFANSALAVYVVPDSTATGLPEWEIEIANA